MKYLMELIDSCPENRRISHEQYSAFLGSFQALLKMNPFVLAEDGLTRSEIMLLYQAMEFSRDIGGDITVAEAAKCLEVSMPAVSRTLRSLSEKGFIERNFNENDRRSVRIVVTESGKNALERFLKTVFSVLDKAMEEFTDDELMKIIELHGRFVKAIKKAAKSERSKDNA